MYSHPEITNIFLDKNESFGWHDGQQMPDASIQVSMLKDLVSLSEPTNAYSFLAYLHELGRIYHYLNAQFDAVPRQEFRNYMEWASRKNENIVFGQEVLSVEYTDKFHIRTTAMTATADNIVVGAGVQPWLPPQARAHVGDRQFHVSEFLSKASDLAACESAWSAAASRARKRSSNSPLGVAAIYPGESSGYRGDPTTSRSMIRRSPTTSICRTTPTTSPGLTPRPGMRSLRATS